ncbi:Phage capsid scaffolding protein [Escherichia coli B7A]|nr:Phage capsid scaffolding protein [Escherichia coli B7A]
MFTALTEKVKSIFGRKQASDDARLNDVHEAVTAVAEHVQEKLSATEQRLSEMETAFSALKQEVTDRADENQPGIHPPEKQSRPHRKSDPAAPQQGHRWWR